MTAVSSIEEAESNWSELPCDILYLIMDKLSSTNLHDNYLMYIRSSSVCCSWHSIFQDHNPQFPPLLMVPPPSSFSKNNKRRLKKYRTKLRTFYNVFDKKVHDKINAIKMPRYRQCRGSSHGWLITVDDDDHKSFSIRLYNPLFGTEIILPDRSTFPITSDDDLPGDLGYEYLRKAVLSNNPLSNPTDYMIMAIYNGCSRLAFFKPGNKAWSPVELPLIKDNGYGFYEDVIYYQGKFLAVHYRGTVVVCDDIAEGGMAAKILVQPPKMAHNNFTKYIVESSRGTLLQVHRDIDISINDNPTIYSTTGFRVFELAVHDHSIITESDYQEDGLPEDYYEWVELNSLCGDAIFLGHNASISICASDYYPGCKPNRIYYADDSDFCIIDRRDGPHDMGTFNLEDGSFERHFLLNQDDDNTSIVPIWPVPIWVQPSLPRKVSCNNNIRKK